MGFWGKLKRPFLCLAPMEDVTDTVFRQIVASVARPDVFFTEFTSTDGMCSPGFEKVAQRLKYCEVERPIVAQIWGKEPERFRLAAKMIADMGFDGIDINFGCPERSIVKQGACGAMIGDKDRVGEIIAAVREGVGKLPMSVKTRIGNKQIATEDWIGFLLEQNLAAITVHGRTVAQMSMVTADWGEIKKVVGLRDDYMKRNLPVADASGSFHIPRVETLVIGNGDVRNYAEGMEKVGKYGVDGVMIGRGIFENIAAFSPEDRVLDINEKIDILKRHLKLWEETWGDTKNFAIMKKFVKMYVNGFEGASQIREVLMKSRTAREMVDIIRHNGNRD